MPSSALTSCSSARAQLSTPGPTRAPSHLPTPCNPSLPPIPLPIADAEASTTGRERRVRKSINYAEPKLNTCVLLISYSNPPRIVTPYQKDAQAGSYHAGETIVVGGFFHTAATAADADVPMIIERWRKSRPRLPVDDDEESGGAQADEVPLAGSRVRTGMANVDTWRRSAIVVPITSRRSLMRTTRADGTACSL